VVGQGDDELRIALRNVPARVGKPVGCQIETALDRDEEVQDHDFARRPVGAKRFLGRGKDDADARDCIPDRRDPGRKQ